MKVEDLLKLLHDTGLNDNEIKKLLTETISTLPAEDVEQEKALAGKKGKRRRNRSKNIARCRFLIKGYIL